MAPGGNAGSGGVPTSRRSFVTGLGAAGAVLPALGLLPGRGFAEDLPQAYAGAAIDWKQFAGGWTCVRRCWFHRKQSHKCGLARTSAGDTDHE